MRGDATSDAGRAGRQAKGAAQCKSIDWFARVGTGEEPARITVRFPELAQFVENWSGQRNPSLLVALADDVEKQIGAIDRFDFESRAFADAQAASVYYG